MLDQIPEVECPNCKFRFHVAVEYAVIARCPIKGCGHEFWVYPNIWHHAAPKAGTGASHMGKKCAVCGMESYHPFHIPGQGKRHEFTPAGASHAGQPKRE